MKKVLIILTIFLLFASVNAENKTVTEQVDLSITVSIDHNVNRTEVTISAYNQTYSYAVSNESQEFNPTFTKTLNFTYEMYPINLTPVMSACINTTKLQDEQYNDLRAYLDNTLLPQQSLLNNLTENLTNCKRYNADLQRQVNVSQIRLSDIQGDLSACREESKLRGYMFAGAIFIAFIMLLSELGLFEKIKGGGYA